MKAIDLNLEELVEFSEGHLDLFGRRLVLHSLNAFAQFRSDVVGAVGVGEARRMFTRFGYFWGQADAAAMRRVFKWDSVTEWIKAGPRMHSLQGVAKVVTKSLKMDEALGTFEMEVAWHDSGEAHEHVLVFGKSSEPVCWMLTGYASGYASFCLGREIYFIERKCRGMGYRLCIASGKDRESWGPEVDRHLPYFGADDIRGTVARLTMDLARRVPSDRNTSARGTGSAPVSFPEVRSEAFRRVVELATRVAVYDTSILITGESGTGKEVLARRIHGMSARSKGPFVAINGGALPDNLLENELFGHVKGAFTGADRTRSGLFEQAEEGTVFLDEIGDITPQLQLKLLRVLQEREIVPVGGNKPRKIDMRVMTATNRDLKQAVAEGVFREDLFYQLGVVEIEVPPLRSRREDILPLARHFVKETGQKLGIAKLRLDAGCLDYVLAYPWPGNVRELENAVERAAVLCDQGVIRPQNLPPAVTSRTTIRVGGSQADKTLAEMERDYVDAVMRAVGGNKAQASRILDISPSTLWRKLKRRGPLA